MHKTREHRKRPSTGVAPAVSVAEGEETLRQFCTDLADRFASAGGSNSSRWMPAIVSTFGLVASLSLVYVQLSWFFFGVGFAVAGLTMCLFTGSGFNLRPIHLSLARWVCVWPTWEYAFAFALLVAFLVFAIWSGVWGSFLFGSVVGMAVPAIHGLSVGFALEEKRKKIASSLNQLVQDFGQYSVDDELIEAGLPRLMGKNWCPLFEHQFGYSAYRRVVHIQGKVNASLLEGRPSIRDFVADVFVQGLRTRRGPIRTLWNAREDHARNIARNNQASLPHAFWDWEDIDESKHLLVDDLQPVEAVSIDSDGPVGLSPASGSVPLGDPVGSLIAEQCSHYLSSEHWEGLAESTGKSNFDSEVGRRKREYDEMMRRARNSSHLSPETLEFERKMYRLLGDEKRLAFAIVLLVAFLWWVYQTEMMTSNFLSSLWQAIKSVHFASMSTSCARVTSVFAACEPRLVPIGISGWSTLVAAFVMAISSEQRGWRHSLFAVPAAMIVLAGMTASLVAGESAMIGWASVVIAFTLLGASAFWVRSQHRKRFQSH